MDKDEIMNILKSYNIKNVPVLMYEDLKRLKTCIFLYTGPTMGHWCCIVKHPHSIEVFDPEGVCIDDEFKFNNITKQFFDYIENGKVYKTSMLRELCIKTPLQVEYNNKKFQKSGDTCALWCIWRIINRKQSCEQFLRENYKTTNKQIAEFFQRLDLLK